MHVLSRVRRKRTVVGAALAASGLTLTLLTATPAHAVSKDMKASFTLTAKQVKAAKRQGYATHLPLRVGDRGPLVTRLRTFLGFPRKHHAAYFGPNVKVAVRHLQREVGLKATGVADRRTFVKARATYLREVRQAQRERRLSPAHILQTARKYSGGYYRHGGSTPSGFDCSGFTMYVFGKLGVRLPHQSSQQYRVVKHVSRSQARPGDLIFFHHGSHIYHVGIYAGHGKLYHASQPGRRTGIGVIYSSSYWLGRVA